MTTPPETRPDLDAIKAEWLSPCGRHDIPRMTGASCTCQIEDYRPVMLSLVREIERLRAAVRHAELFGTGFIWHDPRADKEQLLHPADVTVVIPDGQLTEVEQLRATARRDAHIITLLRRFVADGYTAGTGSAGADLAAAVKAAYPEEDSHG